MKNKNLILLIGIGFILMSSSNAISGIEDEKIQQSGNDPKPELNSSNSTQANVVSTTPDDISLTGSQKIEESTTLTPIQTATSVAIGMIASGTTDKSVVKATLISYGYEDTEAEIAYVKASNSDMLKSPVDTTKDNSVITTPVSAMFKTVIDSASTTAETKKDTPVITAPISAMFKTVVESASTAVETKKDTPVITAPISAMFKTVVESASTTVATEKDTAVTTTPVSSVLTAVTEAVSTVVDTPTVTEPEAAVPTVDAKTRVQSLARPSIKFRTSARVSQQEKNAVNQMLDEGYTVDQIAQGFSDNRYASGKTASLFKQCGVSSVDAYKALSQVVVKNTEKQVTPNNQRVRPLSKFKAKQPQAQTEQQKQEGKSQSVNRTMTELKSAGYDVKETLEVAVQDLKDSGMSAQGIKDCLISNVADRKPRAKFFSRFNNRSNDRPTMTSYGQGEISLASAMIKSGYTESEVESTLQSGNYRYSSDNAQLIVAAATPLSSSESDDTTKDTTATTTSLSPSESVDTTVTTTPISTVATTSPGAVSTVVDTKKDTPVITGPVTAMFTAVAESAATEAETKKATPAITGPVSAMFTAVAESAATEAETKKVTPVITTPVSAVLTAVTEAVSTVLDKTPSMSAKDRVAQTVKPRLKFGRGYSAVTAAQKETVNKMLDEGYSVEQIAQGFNDNKYSPSKTAYIFKAAGVSSKDAYAALSSLAVKRAEANGSKPTAKFVKRFPNRVEEQKNLDKQGAIKTTINQMSFAGYNVQENLDTVVQDLKGNGMSAQGVKDFMISRFAEGRPRANFFNMFNNKPTMTSYGQGEISLASAMLKSGYTKSEVESTLQSGNYKYTSADAQAIVGAAATNISNQAAANLTPASPDTTTNNNTQEDLLKRNTQALPI